jgi:hypothetical protein
MTNTQSKIDLLKQCIVILEAENTKVKAENVKLKQAMGENAKLKAESLQEVKMRERIEKTMLELDDDPTFLWSSPLEARKSQMTYTDRSKAPLQGNNIY